MKTGLNILILACSILLCSLPAYSQLRVWPGDTNDDGVVNNIDVLYLGLGYNTQGIARDTVSIAWDTMNATPWVNVLPDSVTNYAHLDCDGNGFIHDNDLLAIEQNYGLTHANSLPDSFPPINASSPLFYFGNIPNNYSAGETIAIDIFAGTDSIPAIFSGVAFSLEFDTTFIQPNSWIITPDSVINSPVNGILFFSTDVFVGNGLIEAALTRRANSGGSTGSPIVLTGQKLATISFIIEDNLIGKRAPGPLVLGLTEIRMVDFGLSKTSGVGDQISIPFDDGVGIGEAINDPSVQIYPQPASERLVVKGLTTASALAITDLTGKTVIHKALNGHDTQELDCGALPAGLYILIIDTPEGKTVKKILIE